MRLGFISEQNRTPSMQPSEGLKTKYKIHSSVQKYYFSIITFSCSAFSLRKKNTVMTSYYLTRKQLSLIKGGRNLETVIYANFAWCDQHLALGEYFSELKGWLRRTEYESGPILLIFHDGNSSGWHN